MFSKGPREGQKIDHVTIFDMLLRLIVACRESSTCWWCTHLAAAATSCSFSLGSMSKLHCDSFFAFPSGGSPGRRVCRNFAACDTLQPLTCTAKLPGMSLCLTASWCLEQHLRAKLRCLVTAFWLWAASPPTGGSPLWPFPQERGSPCGPPGCLPPLKHLSITLGGAWRLYRCTPMALGRLCWSPRSQQHPGACGLGHSAV